jgi:hypothetical protein
MRPIEITGGNLCVPAFGNTSAVGVTLKIKRDGTGSSAVTLSNPTYNNKYLCFTNTPELLALKEGRYTGFLSGVSCAKCIPLTISCK